MSHLAVKEVSASLVIFENNLVNRNILWGFALGFPLILSFLSVFCTFFPCCALALRKTQV